MKNLCTTIAAACLALAGASSFAQDATKAQTNMETKKAMSMQDCKEHANTAKGQKATDPATAMTADKCADMKHNDSMKMKKNGMKKDGMKNESGVTQEQPAAPSK